MDVFERFASLVVLIGAALVVLAQAARKARTLARTVDRVEALLRPAVETISEELTPNTGGSMKDDLHGVAVALGEAQRRLDHLEAGQDDLKDASRRHGRHLTDIDRRVTQHLKEWDQ